jgi:ribosomal protein S18 acetylase RimI-like enzyme
MSEGLVVSDLISLGQREALEILAQITRIERKTFPSSEVFDFSMGLWRKKPNTRVLYATVRPPSLPPFSICAPPTLVAYTVYVRQKGAALLHKICVTESYRGKGIGRKLLDYVCQRLRKEDCQYIQLWVDEARKPARALYSGCGFEEQEKVVDYYAPGRTGIRMILNLEHTNKTFPL